MVLLDLYFFVGAVPVAQMDRVPASEAGCGSSSLPGDAKLSGEKTKQPKQNNLVGSTCEVVLFLDTARNKSRREKIFY